MTNEKFIQAQDLIARINRFKLFKLQLEGQRQGFNVRACIDIELLGSRQHTSMHLMEWGPGKTDYAELDESPNADNDLQGIIEYLQSRIKALTEEFHNL